MEQEKHPAIHAQNISVQYGKITAVDKASITIRSGTICGLVGPNGSGKSSLFKALMGVVSPQNGEITIAGQAAASARKQGLVAYVPQSEQLDWDFPLNVQEIVSQGRYGGLSSARRLKKQDRELVQEALERVELTQFAHHQIGELSGGQRKRAFIARALAQNAKILLLDEPFAGVDAPTAAAISKILKELANEGCTILISTHDLAGVPELCDEVILFNKKPLIHGNPEDALQPEQIAQAFGLTLPNASKRDDQDASSESTATP